MSDDQQHDSTLSRVILHADMDAFYAAVEQRDNPDLRGRPVAVGGPSRRGVVAAASYEARQFGIHSAMPTAQALRRCAHLVVLPPRLATYAAISRQVFSIFSRFTPLVEPLSLDEAFLDLSGTERLSGTIESVARSIKIQVKNELDLTVSVGGGPSKLVAKIASDLSKPDGLLLVPAAEVRAFLHPLPVSRLFGVGKVTEKKLHRLGITTIGELAAQPRALIADCLGEPGGSLWEQAQGIDKRAVIVERTPESIGQEDTFAEDLTDEEALGQRIQQQADRVARRLRREGFLARTVVLKLKSAEFKLRTRRKTLPRPTADGNQIGRLARELLGPLLRTVGPVRLVGVIATGLVPGTSTAAPQQLSFPEPEQEQGERLGQALDEISAKFGQGALVRATTLAPKKK